MLRLENVTKIYNKGKKNEFKALSGINLEFPEKGLVFIVGKSGCGKTTLLNILGQLDFPDGGKVWVDGKCGFTEKEADDYRNRYIGIIFQEFNLLEDLTVAENVRLAREINRDTLSDEELTDVLKSVDLQGMGNRRINQLSGGQRQRVAIARTLTKNPKIILADEPTGNLDKKNGVAVMNMLKTLSRERLVVVITHDRESAEKYADRLIRLSDGRVIADEVKNEHYRGNVFAVGRALYVTKHAKVDDGLIFSLNTRRGRKVLPSPESPFRRYTDKCTDTSVYSAGAKTVLPAKTLSKLAFAKIKRHRFKFLISVLLIIISLTVFGVSSMLSAYDIGKVSADNFAQFEETGILIKKAESLPPFGYVNRGDGLNLYEEDRQLLLQSEYIDALDPFYKINWGYLRFYNLSTGSEKLSNTLEGWFETNEGRMPSYGYRVKEGGVFPDSPQRDQNGHYHVAITDYTAYVMLLTGAEDAEGNPVFAAKDTDLVGKVINFNEEDFYISAILETGAEKFFPYLEMRDEDIEPRLLNEMYEKIYSVYQYLYVAEGFHQNFFTEVFYDIYSNNQRISYSRFQSDGKGRVVWADYKTEASSLGKGEVLISRNAFASIFGEPFRSDAEYTYQYYYNNYGGTVYLGDFKVAGILEGMGTAGDFENFYVFEDGDFVEAVNKYPKVNAYYAALPQSASGQAALVSFLDKNIYFYETQSSWLVYDIYNQISVYMTVFLYVSIILAIAGALFIIEFMLSNVKDRQSEIGVLRAMGVRGADISKMFLLQALFIFILGAILCVVLITGLTALLNNILFKSFTAMYDTVLLQYMSMLSFSVMPYVYTVVLMFVMLMVSALFPTLRLSRMKPIDCIKK